VFPVSYELNTYILSRVGVTYRRVLDWMIGFIAAYTQKLGVQAIQCYR
jgi:hypothetical protein